MDIERAGSVSLESLIPGWEGPPPVWPTDDIPPANMPGPPAVLPQQGEVVEVVVTPSPSVPQQSVTPMAQAPLMPSDNAIWLSKEGEAIGMLAGEVFPISAELAAASAECLLSGYAIWQSAKMQQLATQFGVRKASEEERPMPEAQPARGVVRDVPSMEAPENGEAAS